MVDRRPVPGGSLLPPERHPDPHSAAARAPRRHPGARRALHPQARAARGQDASRASRPACSKRCRRPTGPATCASSRTRSSAPSCCRSKPTIGPDVVRLLGVPHDAAGRPAVAQPAPQSGLGGAGDRPARARQRWRREEGRGRGDGHQPACAELLPREAPHRIAGHCPLFTARKRLPAA